MQLIGLLCVAAYCVVATLVAIRMLRLAGRTGELPELVIGCALMLGGAVGFPATVLAPALASAHPDLALRFGLAGSLGLHLSCFANLLAWYAIFHPGVRWARSVAVALTLTLFVSLVDRLAGTTGTLHLTSGAQYPPGYYVSLAVQGTPYLLMALSGFRYYAQLSRRLGLGLADPVVVNRIWLWSATSAVVVVQYAISLATLHLRSDPELAAATNGVLALLGLLLGALLTLAFLPPRSYLARVTRRAAH